jgi:cell division protein FtsW
MLIAGVPMKFMGYLGVGAAGIGGIAAFVLGQRGGTFVNRIKAFVSGDEIPFQAQQAYIALANGGIFGQGPGNSVQKDFLPHPYSDFIYAILVEEWGMIGGLVVLLAYLILLYRGMVAVAKSQNAFGALLSAGLSFSLAIQAMLNMAVAVGLAPITGQTLPMLSMGGSSLLSSGAMLGIILSVSRGNLGGTTSGSRVSAGSGNVFRSSPAKAKV